MMSVAATEDLRKFEVDGLIQIVVDGEVVPRFPSKRRGKYVNHCDLSEDEAVAL